VNFEQPIVSDDELFKAVNIGHKTEEFLKNDPMGRKLVERALQEWKQAVYDFESMGLAAVFKSPEKVAEIHQRMRLSRSFILWMNDSILDANRAEEELRNRDTSDQTID